MNTLNDLVQPISSDKKPLPKREPGKNGYPVGGERQPVPQV